MWNRLNGVSNVVVGGFQSTLKEFSKELALAAAPPPENAEEDVEEEEGVDAPHDTRSVAPVKQPNPSRIMALKARLEAERKQAAQRASHDGQQAPAGEAIPFRPPSQQAGPQLSPTTPASQGLARGEEDKAFPSALRDDFVDIPLNSPEQGQLKKITPPPRTAAAAATAKEPSPPPKHPSQAATAPVGTGNGTTGVEAELGQLQGQLQRLKAQMVQAAASQDEELARTQQEHEERIADLAGQIAVLKRAAEDAEGRASRAQIETAVSHAVQECQAAADAQQRQAEQQWAEQLQLAEADLDSARHVNAQPGAGIPFQDAKAGHNNDSSSELEAQLADRDTYIALLQEQVKGLREELAAVSQEGVRQSLEAELAAEQGKSASLQRQVKELAGRCEQAECQPVGQSDSVLADLDREKNARQHAEEQLAEALQALSGAEGDIEAASAALAERDAFWTAELQRERVALARAAKLALEQEEWEQKQQKKIAALLEDKARLEAAATQSVGAHDLEQRLQAAEARCADLEQEAGREAEAEALLQEASDRIADLKERLDGLQASALADARSIEEEQEALQREAEAATAEALDLRRRLGEVGASHAEALSRVGAEVAARLAEQDTFWQQEVARREATISEMEVHLADLAAKQEQHSAILQEDLASQLEAVQQQLERQLQSSRRLQEELEEQRRQLSLAQQVTASEDELRERHETELQEQLHISQVDCHRLQAEVVQLRGAALPGDADNTRQEWETALQDALKATEEDRDRAKQQLNRLKQQLVTSQEEEEEQLRWRMDAEVRIAVQEAQAALQSELASRDDCIAALEGELASMRGHVSELHNTLTQWESAVAARDAELQTLQGALGELTYESEAAERLRSELRAAHAAHEDTRSQLAAAQAAEQAAKEAQTTAAAEAEAQRHRLEQQSNQFRALQEEGATLRRALAESMRRAKVANNDTDAMVDRRLVVKLLVTFFQRGQSPEILALMARLLAFSEEDKVAVRQGSQRRGVLSSVASMPFSLVQGTVGLAKGRLAPAADRAGNDGDASLADSWVEFLIQQAQAAETAEEQGINNGEASGAAAQLESAPRAPIFAPTNNSGS